MSYAIIIHHWHNTLVLDWETVDILCTVVGWIYKHEAILFVMLV